MAWDAALWIPRPGKPIVVSAVKSMVAFLVAYEVVERADAPDALVLFRIVHAAFLDCT